MIQLQGTHAQHPLHFIEAKVYAMDLKIELERRGGKVENELWNLEKEAACTYQKSRVTAFALSNGYTKKKCFRIFNRVLTTIC